MSSPGNVRQKHGRDNDEHEGDSDDLNLQKSLPSSSQQKTPTKPVFGNKVNSESVKTSHHMSFSNKYDLVFPEPVESDNDETLWDVRDLSHRNRWSSVDPESAGPSKTVSTVLSESSTDTAVSERELTQLAQIRPLIFNSSSRAALRDCLKALQKKEELDIIREFLFNIMNIVTQMRKQRFGMIQTKEQYQFCYEIVLEVLQNLLALN